MDLCGQKGKFEHGFLSGFVSSLGGSYSPNVNGVVNTAMAATLGGTAETLGGGKFSNGAVTGAFVYLLNHAAHKWHSTRESASNAARTRTETTGNEASYIIYEDECGDGRYWEVPADPRDSPTLSIQTFPPASETKNLKMVEQYHFSPQSIVKDGKIYLLKGSYGDWKLARDEGITVTHHSIGTGVWIFRPTPLFVQPISVIFTNFISWDKSNPAE